MTQTTPPSASACEHCPCNQDSASFGQQLMHLFEQLTAQERSQMLKLIDDILAAGRQQPKASASTTTTQRKRRNKR